MINKNMMEKSVITLKNNVPVFVRNSYAQFTEVFKETIDIVKTLAQTQPYTADKLAAEMLDGLPMLSVLKELLSEEKYNKILKRLTDLNISVTDKPNVDEEFSIINGTDVYAPLTHICACITPFAAKKFYKYKDKVIPVVFEICRNQHPIEILSNYDNGFKPITSDDIEGFQGQKTIFDNLGTCLGIDVAILFQRYLSDLLIDCPIGEGKVDSVDIFENAYGRINDEFAVAEIEQVTKDLMAITVSTYFVYASKLIGSKTDIYSWAYTAFVKDSMDHFDKANYPVNANITRASGHAENGSGYAGDSGKYDENTSEVNMVEKTGGDSEISNAYKAIIYRNIRLQYSSWATVINAIFTSAFRAKRMDEGSGIFTEEWSRNLGRGKGFDNFAATSTEYNKMCKFVCEVLIQYCAAKYRTYNTAVQLCGEQLNPEDSSFLIDNVISGCRDESAVKIAKESIKGYKIKDIYIPYNEFVSGVLTANEGVKKSLANTFMDTAYLIILNYVHATMSKVMEEIEPVTGKSNKQLFEEIYYGIKHKIYMNIDEYSWKEYAKYSINDAVVEYTPYPIDNNFDNGSILNDLHVEKTTEDPTIDDIHKLEGFNPFIEVVCVPFVSEYSKLKQVYDFSNNFNSSRYTSTQNQTESRFPKNKIIVDGLAKLGHELTLNRAFSSIESAEACVKNLKERVEEGADAMANNACYSALGAIGGGITEIEIRNEADDNFISDSVAKLTDSEGTAIKTGTSDTLDLANAVSHAIESAAPNPLKQSREVVSSFNTLFNNVILGI